MQTTTRRRRGKPPAAEAPDVQFEPVTLAEALYPHLVPHPQSSPDGLDLLAFVEVE